MNSKQHGMPKLLPASVPLEPFPPQPLGLALLASGSGAPAPFARANPARLLHSTITIVEMLAGSNCRSATCKPRMRSAILTTVSSSFARSLRIFTSRSAAYSAHLATHHMPRRPAAAREGMTEDLFLPKELLFEYKYLSTGVLRWEARVSGVLCVL